MWSEPFLIFQFDGGAGILQEAFWKALQPIVHRESHAGFGRGEGMGDHGTWVMLAKRSEN